MREAQGPRPLPTADIPGGIAPIRSSDHPAAAVVRVGPPYGGLSWGLPRPTAVTPKDALLLAQRAEDDADKALWLTLAQCWVRLAEHVARGPSHPHGDDANATDAPHDRAD
jgi:hypothetical protein